MIGITPRLIEKIRFHTVICKPVCVIQKAAEDQRYRRATDAHTADQDFRRIFHAAFMRHHQHSTNSAVASTTWLSGVMA